MPTDLAEYQAVAAEAARIPSLAELWSDALLALLGAKAEKRVEKCAGSFETRCITQLLGWAEHLVALVQLAPGPRAVRCRCGGQRHSPEKVFYRSRMRFV